VEVGDQHPEQTEQAKSQERVVDPQPALGVVTHTNVCSLEHPFWCKNSGWHKGVTVALATALLMLSAACLPDPQRNQTVQLLDQLTTARGVFADQPERLEDACNAVGDVQTRLYGEPGLVDVRPAWPELRDAADALHAVCSQHRLLAQPSTGSAALEQAHQRWQQGIQREMSVACDHLRAAATALERPAPC
jgi:hypothetical protein